tara:strand:+ start:424 stop:1230 length:807 start_codon:yes stop_codon:yes gene_type:complete
MTSKYFTVEVKPIISAIAAGLHTAFADGDVLFDWHAFQIPRGGGRLIGAHAELRPKGDSGATPNKFPLELLFGRHNFDHPNEGGNTNYTGPSTLGALNSAPANSGNISTLVDTFIGQVPIVAGDFADSIDPLAIASTSDTNGIILQRQEGQHNRGNVGGGTAGTSRFYIAGIAGGDLDFVSATLINNGTLDGSVFTVDGTDPRLHIAPGDTIRACTATDTSTSKTLGTVASMADANTITLTDTTSVAVVNNDIIYNTSPIRILLTFER